MKARHRFQIAFSDDPGDAEIVAFMGSASQEWKRTLLRAGYSLMVKGQDSGSARTQSLDPSLLSIAQSMSGDSPSAQSHLQQLLPAAEGHQVTATPPLDQPAQVTFAAPVQQPAPAPVQQPVPAPAQQPAPAPVQQPAPAPVQQPAPAPVQQPAPAPVQQPAPAPVQQPAPAPVQQPAPAPAQQPAPAPAHQPSATPESMGADQGFTTGMSNTTQVSDMSALLDDPSSSGGDLVDPLAVLSRL